MNATQHTNPMDDYPVSEKTIANLKKEKIFDPVTAKVVKWMETESAPTANIYFTEEQKYLRQLRSLFTENGIFYSVYFAHDGKMLYKQLCMPKTLLKEVMYRIHNAPTGGHFQMKRVLPSRQRPPLQESSTLKSFPGELMQMEILGPFPSSPDKYVLTAIDVFTKYLFAVPLTTVNAISVATAQFHL